MRKLGKTIYSYLRILYACKLFRRVFALHMLFLFTISPLSLLDAIAKAAFVMSPTLFEQLKDNITLLVWIIPFASNILAFYYAKEYFLLESASYKSVSSGLSFVVCLLPLIEKSYKIDFVKALLTDTAFWNLTLTMILFRTLIEYHSSDS